MSKNSRKQYFKKSLEFVYSKKIFNILKIVKNKLLDLTNVFTIKMFVNIRFTNWPF